MSETYPPSSGLPPHTEPLADVNVEVPASDARMRPIRVRRPSRTSPRLITGDLTV